MTQPVLPDPVVEPLLKLDRLVGLVPGLGRSAIYEAARRGQIPTVRVGSRLFVPTAALRRAWGLDLTEGEAGSVHEPADATADNSRLGADDVTVRHLADRRPDTGTGARDRPRAG